MNVVKNLSVRYRFTYGTLFAINRPQFHAMQRPRRPPRGTSFPESVWSAFALSGVDKTPKSRCRVRSRAGMRFLRCIDSPVGELINVESTARRGVVMAIIKKQGSTVDDIVTRPRVSPRQFVRTFSQLNRCTTERRSVQLV